MKIFSVTVLIFLTHSLSLTMGTLASRIFSGIGPAANLGSKMIHTTNCTRDQTKVSAFTTFSIRQMDLNLETK